MEFRKTKIYVKISNIIFIIVDDGALDVPLASMDLFLSLSIIYLLVFQALMPRGTPTCLPCLKGSKAAERE